MEDSGQAPLLASPLSPAFHERGVMVRPNGSGMVNLGLIETNSLRGPGAFNGLREPGDAVFTEELGVGERHDFRAYPFEAVVTHFGNNHNEFELLDDEGNVVWQANLLSKRGQIFDYDGQYYLVFVVPGQSSAGIGEVRRDRTDVPVHGSGVGSAGGAGVVAVGKSLGRTDIGWGARGGDLLRLLRRCIR